MRVKIGSRYYDSTKQPIMVVFTDAEKEQLRKMGKQYRFASTPKMDEKVLEAWMDLDKPMTKVSSEQEDNWEWKVDPKAGASATPYALMRKNKTVAFAKDAEEASKIIRALNNSPIQHE